ncbi:MAG: hypothetical protein ACLPSF_11410 [Methylocella sp.]
MAKNTFRTFLIIFAVLCGVSTKAYAVGEGRLLFVNPTTGRVVGAGVDKNGNFHSAFDVVIPSQKGKDTIIPTTSGFVLYSYYNGGAQAYLMDGDGSIRPGALSYPFSKQWYDIISVGDFILFYNLNGNQGIGAVVEANPDGSLLQTNTKTNLSPWTLIGHTNNYLFFYNKPNGLVVTATISSTGLLFQNTTAVNLRSGYTNFASVGDDILLWNVANGLWESGSITYDALPSNDKYIAASVATTNSLGLVGFDEAVESNGHLLLYNSATGAAITGHFIRPAQFGGQPGTFVKDQSFVLPKYFTNLVQCGQFLVFYGFGVGQLQVGYIDFAGKYQATQSFPMGAGLSVAATKN